MRAIKIDLLTARKTKGMTQMDLALAANVRQSTISQIETGQRNPSVRVIAQLADALGMTIDELIKKEV